MPSTGKRCEADGFRNSGGRCACPDEGREEFCGYCAEHWRGLNYETRKLLKTDYIPGPPLIQRIVEERQIQPVIERIRTIYPARSVLSTITLWTWRLVITAAVAWLIWRGR